MKLRELKEELENLGLELEKDELKETLEKMKTLEPDFMVGDFRFIHQDDIDDIMREEMLSDKYVLGCYRAWFIADVTGLDIDIVEKGQKAENYVLLGELVAENIDKAQELASETDGYGHFFNMYDGSEEIIGDYYVFRTN
jgi:hypothetical protein